MNAYILHKYQFSSLGSIIVKFAQTSSSLSRKLVRIKKQLDRLSEDDLHCSSLYTKYSRNVLVTLIIFQENNNLRSIVLTGPDFGTCMILSFLLI